MNHNARRILKSLIGHRKFSKGGVVGNVKPIKAALSAGEVVTVKYTSLYTNGAMTAPKLFEDVDDTSLIVGDRVRLRHQDPELPEVLPYTIGKVTFIEAFHNRSKIYVSWGDLGAAHWRHDLIRVKPKD